MKDFDAAILEKWIGIGFCSGKGDGVNSVCVEQAVSLALGLELTDHPEKQSCISPAVAAFKRLLNDCCWSSPTARSAGLRSLAYEQLDSAGISDTWFASRLVELTIKILLPRLFREVANGNTAMLEAADRCEREGTVEAVRAAYAAVEAARAARAAVRAVEAARAARAAVRAEAAARAPARALAEAAYAAVRASAEAVSGKDDYLLLCAELELQALKEAKVKAGKECFFS